MKRLITILASLPFCLCADETPTILGWLCKTTWAAYVVTQVTNPDTGVTSYTGSYSGEQYTLIKFYPSSSSTAPTLGQLGFVEYCQLDGTPLPKDSWGNPNQVGTFYLCQPNLQANKVYSSAPQDLINALGDLNSAHTIGPIYVSSAGLPYTLDDFGNVSGFNNNFNPQTIVQGPSGDKYIVYTQDGQPILSPINQGYQWVNDGNGNWNLQQIINSDNPSGGSIDLTPLVSSIETVQAKQDLQRQQLVDLLGSAGNSWVYDCKLSLADLQDLAASLGLKVDTANSSLSAFKSSFDDFSTSHAGFRRTLNTSVNTIKSSVSSIDSKLSNIGLDLNAQRSSVFDIKSTLGNVYTKLGDLTPIDYTSILEDILHKLPDEDADIPSLPQPNLTNDAHDNLPFDNDDFNTDAQGVFNSIQHMTEYPSEIFGSHSLGYLEGFLSRALGTIPSVSKDPVMFEIHWDIPYIGTINRVFSFEDWSIIPIFREAMAWVVALFFALACYHLIHRSII